LKAVPVKYVCRYQDIAELPELFPDVALSTLLRWEEEHQKNPPDGFYVQRVWPALYNMDTNDHQRTREIRDPENGTRFRVTTWQKDPEFKIEVPMEFNLLTNFWTGRNWIDL
jgi:hypothetical protein